MRLVERIPHSGAICISELVGSDLFTRTYYGYTRKEANKAFTADKRWFVESIARNRND